MYPWSMVKIKPKQTKQKKQKTEILELLRNCTSMLSQSDRHILLFTALDTHTWSIVAVDLGGKSIASILKAQYHLCFKDSNVY